MRKQGMDKLPDSPALAMPHPTKAPENMEELLL